MSDVIEDHLDEREAQVIAQAPVLVFLLVSAADGTIDKHEIRGFVSLLSSPPYSGLLAVMERAKLSILGTLRQLTENPVDYLAELRRIERILDNRLPVALAQQLKRQLYDLGHRIVTASERVQVEADNSISEQEQVALKVIAGLFDIDERQC